MGEVVNTFMLWFVVTLTPGVDVKNHYFCHGFGSETRCDWLPNICVFDDPRADVLCPRTFKLDFEVTESGGTRTLAFCTPPAYTVTWPGLIFTEQQSEACSEIHETIGPWNPQELPMEM